MTETAETDRPLIREERPEPGIARLVLNRPETRNAQSGAMLYALNEAIDRASADDAVVVIILAADGPHFSSGHDLREESPFHELDNHRSVSGWSGYTNPGPERMFAREKEIYLGLSERWRNIPKPMIAEVQGKAVAGAMMLIWPCDIIIAADDAQFMDNTMMMGINGAEFFQHPYELGPRKAKEWLWTAEFLSAEEAHRRGMVNQVVPREALSDATLAMARKIAQMPPFALKLSKECINAAEDAAGRQTMNKLAFALHHVLHCQNYATHGLPIDPRAIAGTLGRDRDIREVLKGFLPDDAPEKSSS